LLFGAAAKLALAFLMLGIFISALIFESLQASLAIRAFERTTVGAGIWSIWTSRHLKSRAALSAVQRRIAFRNTK
jgi:hypothetical protein